MIRHDECSCHSDDSESSKQRSYFPSFTTPQFQKIKVGHDVDTEMSIIICNILPTYVFDPHIFPDPRVVLFLIFLTRHSYPASPFQRILSCLVFLGPSDLRARWYPLLHLCTSCSSRHTHLLQRRTNRFIHCMASFTIRYSMED